MCNKLKNLKLKKMNHQSLYMYHAFPTKETNSTSFSRLYEVYKKTYLCINDTHINKQHAQQKQHAQHKQTTCTTYTKNMHNINKQHAQRTQTTCTT